MYQFLATRKRANGRCGKAHGGPGSIFKRGGKARVALLSCLAMGASSSCVAPDDDVARTESALISAVPPVSHYALMAARTITLGDRTTLSGGDIGVAAGGGGTPNSLTVGFDSRVAVANVSLAPAITLRDRAVIGEIGANVITVPPTATTGPRSAYVAPPAAPVPGAFTVGTAAITVAAGQTRILAPGRYGVVTVDGVLQLSGGLYEIQSLRLGVAASVVAMGASTVRMSIGLVAADRARVGTAASLGASALRLVAAGTIDTSGNSVVLGTDNRLTALVIAGNGFRAADRLLASGAISARDVRFGNDARMTFDGGFECGAASACGDGNACTTEACVDSRCAITNAPPGTACDDGNGCTQTSACAAGSCVGANPVVCGPPDQCHTQGVCQPATGQCTNPSRPDGTTCSDGNACTDGESCLGGQCAGGQALVTEYPTGLVGPRSVVNGPDGRLWFVSPEATPGGTNGSVGRLAPDTGAVAAFPADRRLNDISGASDGNLWLAEQLPVSDFVLPSLGKITTDGVFLPSLVGLPAERVHGAMAGKVWFTSAADGLYLVGAIKTDIELITNFLVVGNAPRGITTGPDGNLWITESNGGVSPALIGRITSNDVLTEFPVTTSGELNGIVTGPDGNLWFTDAGQNQIGRIAPDGSGLTKYDVPTPASGLHGIAVGPDGNLWFTEETGNRIGRITPLGDVTELACIPTTASGPTSITLGVDGNLWIAQTAAGSLARLRVP